MKKIALFALPALLLTACGSDTISDETRDALSNPLFAERYHEDRMIHMANLIIQNDSLLQDSRMKDIIEDLRLSSQDEAQAANALQLQGRKGAIISDEEYSRGEALLLDGMLYFSPDFITTPSADLRVYLSNVTDPRDGFPDASALEIGRLQSPYGEQTYAVPAGEDGLPASFVTLVIWDATFGRIYGFAQLR